MSTHLSKQGPVTDLIRGKKLSFKGFKGTVPSLSCRHVRSFPLLQRTEFLSKKDGLGKVSFLTHPFHGQGMRTLPDFFSLDAEEKEGDKVGQ